MIFKQTFPTPAEHSAGKNTCKYIVLHHTGTKEGTINGVLDGLNKRADYASCHYCVDTNGDVYKMGNDTDILWHAGVSSWNGLTDLNNHSIGIETIGPMSNGGFTDEQRKAVAELIKYLCDLHGLTADNVVRHKDIAPQRKVDIADTFWNGVSPSWADWKKSIFAAEVEKPSSWAVPAFAAAKRFGYSDANPKEVVGTKRDRQIYEKHPRYGQHIDGTKDEPITYEEKIMMFYKAGDFNQ